MTESSQALVLHLASSGEPILLAIADDAVDELARRLPELIRRGTVDNVTAANGAQMTINFAHVAAAHIDTDNSLRQIYGSPKRVEAGYRS
jgi:hypothetical protein